MHDVITKPCCKLFAEAFTDQRTCRWRRTLNLGQSTLTSRCDRTITGGPEWERQVGMIITISSITGLGHASPTWSHNAAGTFSKGASLVVIG